MNTVTDGEIVSFTRPPIVEVICGVQFLGLPLQTVHLGQFWDRVRETYPKTLDAPPLPDIVEAPTGSPGPLSTLTWSQLPDLRRVFFVNEDRGRLLQLQGSRLLHNWQRKDDGDTYPHFPEVRSEFLDKWGVFRAFLRDIPLPPPHVTQAEVTYINHVPIGDLWKGSGVAALFPWLDPSNRVASNPEVECALHYDLPECRGRLHVTVRTALRVKDSARVVVFELTVRGAPAADGVDVNLEPWLAAARGAIVHSFTELTSPEAHTHWGRVK